MAKWQLIWFGRTANGLIFAPSIQAFSEINKQNIHRKKAHKLYSLEVCCLVYHEKKNKKACVTLEIGGKACWEEVSYEWAVSRRSIIICINA